MTLALALGINHIGEVFENNSGWQRRKIQYQYREEGLLVVLYLTSYYENGSWTEYEVKPYNKCSYRHMIRWGKKL